MGKKVKLDLDELDVQSFSTSGSMGDKAGTVRANGTTEASDGSMCLDITCFYGCWGNPPTDAGSCSCGGGTTNRCCPMME